MQVLLVDYKYPASLIDFFSSTEASFDFNHNLVQYNQFVGIESSLIAIDGGTFYINENQFRYNGYVSKELFQGTPGNVDFESDYASWPY